MYAEEKALRSQDLVYTVAEADTRSLPFFLIEDSVICTTFVG